MAQGSLTVDVGLRTYGMSLALFVARLCRFLGFSKETSFNMAVRCLVFRVSANGRKTWVRCHL